MDWKLYLYMVRLQMDIYGYTEAYMGMCVYTLHTTGVCMGILWAYKGIQVCKNICLNTQKNKYTTKTHFSNSQSGGQNNGCSVP